MPTFVFYGERKILFLLLNLDLVPWKSTSGGFAYIWESKWVGIITIRTERTQVHFCKRRSRCRRVVGSLIDECHTYRNPIKLLPTLRQKLALRPKSVLILYNFSLIWNGTCYQDTRRRVTTWRHHLQVSDSISLCPVLPYKDAHALLHVRHNESFPSLLFQYDLIQGDVIKVLGLLEDMLKSRQ